MQILAFIHVLCYPIGMLKIVKDSSPSIRLKCEPVPMPLSQEDKKTLDEMLEYLKLSQDEGSLLFIIPVGDQHALTVYDKAISLVFDLKAGSDLLDPGVRGARRR